MLHTCSAETPLNMASGSLSMVTGDRFLTLVSLVDQSDLFWVYTDVVQQINSVYFYLHLPALWSLVWICLSSFII